MLIPSGYCESGVLYQIDVVVNRIAPRYTFYGYTVSDIKQEAFIICMDALERYEPGRPLENFLSVNLSNRLKNFVRDNHIYGDDNQDRVRIMQPGQLENDNLIVDGRDEADTESLDYFDMARLIDKKLPASMRADYLKMQNEVYISKNRRDEITAEIKEILRDNKYWNEEGTNL